MILKKGITLNGIRPEIVLAMFIVSEIYETYGKELVITSVTDGRHKKYSYHYLGCSFDTRTRYFETETKLKVAREIQSKLGDNYYVNVESDHFHINFRPPK